MEKAKRVLQVLGTTNLGGAESRVMDLYRHMDRQKLQFDFLVHTTKTGHFDEEIKRLGGRIYSLPAFRIYNYFSYKKAIREFFKNHSEYRAVHGHMTSTAAIYLPCAKKAGIPLTIAHARSAGVDKGIKGRLTRWIRKPLYKRADVLLACSDLAAEAVYGKENVSRVIVLPNAIDTAAFAYQKDTRRKLRESLGIEDKFVIGHVGRFHYAKNHEYLLDIFHEIVKKNNRAVLLLVGEGPLLEETRKKAMALGIEEKVLFVGNQSPVAPYYQAMDVFVFPSRFEGMPGTVVEAQAAGLPCFVSDRVTRQVKATDLVSFYSITDSPQVWAEQILTWEGNKDQREAAFGELKESNYDVNHQVKQYEQFYLTGEKQYLVDRI